MHSNENKLKRHFVELTLWRKNISSNKNVISR